MPKTPDNGVPFPPVIKTRVDLSTRKLSIINRVISKCDMVERGHGSPCWEWLGANSGRGDGAGRGYGRIKIDGVVSATHRVMFACFHGYLPPNRDVDHLCHNRICCNPDHLDSVTHKQNCKRRDIKK